MERVVLSKRFSRNAGVVVNPLAKYFGKKMSAVAIMAKAANASQAMTTNALSMFVVMIFENILIVSLVFLKASRKIPLFYLCQI